MNEPASDRRLRPTHIGRPALPLLGLLLALLPFAGACGAEPTAPGLEPTGPAVVEGPLSVTPIRFGPTDPRYRRERVGAEEGRLRVPERHGAAGGREITVHYVRFASTAERPAASIVYLAGGPGGSGTWSAAGDRYPLFRRLREVADVIAYDQRGTWGTEPYTVCPGSWSYPLDRPSDPETLRETLAPFLAECARHWGERADLSAFNTVESAEDLEALRVALGAEKLTLWGISYGTHLALAYLRAHPDRVERAVLAGVEGPDDTYKLPARIDAALGRIDAAIQADPRARAAAPGLFGAVDELAKRLDGSPATVEVRHPGTGETITVVVGGADVREAAYGALTERSDLEHLLERALPVLDGDLTGLAVFALDARREQRKLAMSLSMDCASGVSAERRAAVEAQAPEAFLGDPNVWTEAACASWPVEDLGDGFRAPVHSEVPALFVSGSLDVRTPLENAEAVLAGFPNGRHLIVEGAGHDDDLLLSSPEIADAMVAFLRGEEAAGRIVLAPLRFELP